MTGLSSAMRAEQYPHRLGPVWQRALELVQPAVEGSADAYGLELIAEHRKRALGLPTAEGLEVAEQLGAIAALVAEDSLRRIRAACSGPILLFKGLEVALRYPYPALRPFGDVDVLVP